MRTVSCFFAEAAPYVFTPARRRICSAAVPTPPAAAVTSAVWPDETFASRWIICQAVT